MSSKRKLTEKELNDSQLDLDKRREKLRKVQEEIEKEQKELQIQRSDKIKTMLEEMSKNDYIELEKQVVNIYTARITVKQVYIKL